MENTNQQIFGGHPTTTTTTTTRANFKTTEDYRMEIIKDVNDKIVEQLGCCEQSLYNDIISFTNHILSYATTEIYPGIKEAVKLSVFYKLKVKSKTMTRTMLRTTRMALLDLIDSVCTKLSELSDWWSITMAKDLDEYKEFRWDLWTWSGSLQALESTLVTSPFERPNFRCIVQSIVLSLVGYHVPPEKYPIIQETIITIAVDRYFSHLEKHINKEEEERVFNLTRAVFPSPQNGLVPVLGKDVTSIILSHCGFLNILCETSSSLNNALKSLYSIESEVRRSADWNKRELMMDFQETVLRTIHGSGTVRINEENFHKNPVFRRFDHFNWIQVTHEPLHKPLHGSLYHKSKNRKIVYIEESEGITFHENRNPIYPSFGWWSR